MIEFTIDQQKLQALARRLDQEADGKKLRRDLAKNLRQVIQPAIQEIKSDLLTMSTSGLPHEGEPLRTAVSRGIRAEGRLSGRSTGVRIRARRTPSVRGFKNAPRRLNSARGWRHPIYGSDYWVTQYGKPGFFERPILKRRNELRAAVLAAMEEMAARIAR